MKKGHSWKRLTRQVNQRQVIVYEKDRKTGERKEFSKRVESDEITIGRECVKCGKIIYNPRQTLQPSKEPFPIVEKII